MTLVEHARAELELIGEDPDVIDWMCKTIEAWSSYGHSGGSHAVLLPVLVELIEARNLSPLTNDPDEWEYHNPDIWDGKNPIWQNRRNSEALSEDGGKTFWLIHEPMAEDGGHILHDSHPMKPKVVSPE